MRFSDIHHHPFEAFKGDTAKRRPFCKIGVNIWVVFVQDKIPWPIYFLVKDKIQWNYIPNWCRLCIETPVSNNLMFLSSSVLLGTSGRMMDSCCPHMVNPVESLHLVIQVPHRSWYHK